MARQLSFGQSTVMEPVVSLDTPNITPWYKFRLGRTFRHGKAGPSPSHDIGRDCGGRKLPDQADSRRRRALDGIRDSRPSTTAVVTTFFPE